MRRKKWIYLGCGTAAVVAVVLLCPKMRQTPPRLLHWRDNHYPARLAMGFATSRHLVSLHSEEDMRIREWNTVTGQIVRTVELSPLIRVGSFGQLPHFSRDGKWAAAPGIDGPTLYYLDEKTSSFKPEPPEIHRNEVFVWNVANGQQIAAVKLRTDFVGFGLDFSFDGKLVAVGGETLESAKDMTYKKLPPNTPRGYVEVWDWKASRLVWRRAMNAPVNGVSWADNGNLAVIGGKIVSNGIMGGPNSAAYDRGGEVAVWNPASNQRLMHRILQSNPIALAFAPNGKWVAVGLGFFGTEVWNARTGARHKTLKCPTTGRHGGIFLGSPRSESIEISSDSGRVASSSERGRYGVKVWDLADGEFVGSFNTVGWKGKQSEPTDDAFALSSDGMSLAVGDSNRHEIAVYRLPAP